MPRGELTEAELEQLQRWARTLEPEKARQVLSLVAELRRLRESESTTRFLMAIEGEV